jgi:hypothetical protein
VYRILFFCLALPVFALGRGDRAAPDPGAAPGSGGPGVGTDPNSSSLSVPGPAGAPVRGGDWVELEGRIRLVGSEPFPDLVLTDGTGQDWYLDGPARRTLGAWEQRNVRVRGRVELRELVLANGRSLGIRRGLQEVRVLE